MPFCFFHRPPPPPAAATPARAMTAAQTVTLSQACILITDADAPVTQGDRNLIAHCGRLFLAHGRMAPIDAASWAALERAAAALREREAAAPTTVLAGRIGARA